MGVGDVVYVLEEDTLAIVTSNADMGLIWVVYFFQSKTGPYVEVGYKEREVVLISKGDFK